MRRFGETEKSGGKHGAGRNPAANGRIVLVELTPSIPNLGAFIVSPRYGMLAVSAALKERSPYDIVFLYERYVGRIVPEDVEALEPFCVMTNGLTTSAPDNEMFFGRFRELTNGEIPIIAGGEHASMYPEQARRYADYLLTFEGDETVFPLLKAIRESDPKERERMFSRIPGLHYRDSAGIWRQNREACRVEHIDYRLDFSIMPGARDAGTRFRTARIPLQTSRGCKYACSFCSWISLYGRPGYYVRPPKDIVADAIHTVDYVGTREFFFTDNLFAGDDSHVEETMLRMEEAFRPRGYKPSFTVLMRADQLSGDPSALSDQMVAMLARGGVSVVSFGLESISERSLLQMRKRTTLEKYLAASATLRRHGIQMLGTFASGFDGDTVDDILGIADFAEKMGLFTIQCYSRSITPGTIDMTFSERRIIPGWANRFANGHGVWILPMLMLPSQLQEALFDVALRFHQRDSSRKPAYLAFSRIRRSIEPNLRALRRIEQELLLPMGIYRSSEGRFLLDEDRLHQVHETPDLFYRYYTGCKQIFREEVTNRPVSRDLSGRSESIGISSSLYA